MKNKVKKYFNKKYNLDYWVNKDKYNWVDKNKVYVTLPHQYLCYGIARFFIENYNHNLKIIYPIYKWIIQPLIIYHDKYYIKKLNLIPSERYGIN